LNETGKETGGDKALEDAGRLIMEEIKYYE
jgi:hypothetical protein